MMNRVRVAIVVIALLLPLLLFGSQYGSTATLAVCSSCQGSGTSPFQCSVCKGSGRNINGNRCDFCNGKGFAKCLTCNGTGQR
jgi:DnaJ-class molecular chaperone